MTHLAIVKVSPAGRIEKYQDYSTEAEALAHVARVLPTFPQAYSVLHTGGGVQDLLCDPVTKTVTLSPIPPSKEQVNAPIRAQIVAKERLTDRRVREMVLRWAKAALPADDADRVALEAREAEFAALRAQLQP